MNNNKNKTNIHFSDIDACGNYVEKKIENLMQKMFFLKEKALL